MLTQTENTDTIEYKSKKADALYGTGHYKKYKTFENDFKGDDETWPFNKPQYLLLNLAIGGSWGGQQGIDDSHFPHKFYIDYVRYYSITSKNEN